MRMLPKAVLVVAFVILAGFAFHEARRVGQLLEENQALRAQLSRGQDQADRFQREHDAMDRRLASLADATSALAGDRLKLTEEVESLRKVADSNDVATAAATNESERLTTEAINIMRRAHMNLLLDGKLLTMKHRLNLTAEQEAAMKGVLERLYDPDKRTESQSDAKKHFETDVAAFLSADQLAIVSQMEKEEKMNYNQRTARIIADAEADRVGDNLDLSPEQQTAAAAAMLEIATKSIALQPASGNMPLESGLMLANEKLQALKDILT